MHRGSCLCGAVRFEVDAALPPPDACHCAQCRKFSGHFFVSTDVPKETLVVSGSENVRWYQSSEKARRGFCATCGSSLFWEPLAREWIGIAMGAFEQPTRTNVKDHIYVAEKGDYYELTDSLPRHARYPGWIGG